MTTERVTFENGAFYVRPSEVSLTDAAEGLAQAMTPFIAFADLSIDSLRAEWTDETRRQVLLEAARIVIHEYDDGLHNPSPDPDALRRDLISALAEAVVLRSRLHAAGLGSTH